jgi:drug/metabolite transporter (DMT)-like permease
VPGERWPVAGRAVFGMLNQITWYVSIKYISLTDSSAIYYSAPVYVTVLAVVMLGEPFGLIELTSVVVTLFGVALISKPGFLPFFRSDLDNSTGVTNSTRLALAAASDWIASTTELPLINIHNQTSASTQVLISALNVTSSPLTNYSLAAGAPVASAVLVPLIAPVAPAATLFGMSAHVFGMSLAFGGALTFAFTNICLRKMRKTPTEVIATWFSLFTIVSCTPMAVYMGVMRWPDSLLEWIVVILVGVFSTLGQVAFTLALKIEKAGPVSVAQTLNIVIVLFYQIVFFQEPINSTSLTGVILIIGSVLLIGLKDTLMQQRLMVRVIKRIRRQGQFDLHGSNGTGDGTVGSSVKDGGSHSVQVNLGLPSKQTFCTCHTLASPDISSPPPSHLQVPSNASLDSADQSLRAKLQRKLQC